MYETRDSIADICGDRTPYFGEWKERIDEYIVAEPDRWVQSACGVGKIPVWQSMTFASATFCQ